MIEEDNQDYQKKVGNCFSIKMQVYDQHSQPQMKQ